MRLEFLNDSDVLKFLLVAFSFRPTTLIPLFSPDSSRSIIKVCASRSNANVSKKDFPDVKRVSNSLIFRSNPYSDDMPNRGCI